MPHCGPNLKPLVITALHTGFRKSELLSLRWENVDFRNRLIRVEAGYAKNREVRSVPMNEVLTQTLQDSTLNQSTGPVFVIGRGNPTVIPTAPLPQLSDERESQTLRSMIYAIRSRVGSSWQGWTWQLVKELMGHKHIAMTLRYAHLAPGHKRAAVEVLSGGAGKSPSNFHNTRLIEKGDTSASA